MNVASDRAVERGLLVIALSSIGALGLITLFIFREGFPLIMKIGLGNFLSTEWRPSQGHFGIALMIIGSLTVTLGALVIGVPLSLACSVVLSEIAPARVKLFLKPVIEVQAGIPSVVYGFMGLVVLHPFIRQHFGGPGACALAGSVVLAIMILPTIISISMDALAAVPRSYREASLALGATEWQTTCRVTLPAARSGLVAAVILGLGRALGETMAVIMVTGNAVHMPRSMLDPVRTLTANIALEMGYAAGDHRAALFATGVVLFLIIMALNGIAGLARRPRSNKKKRTGIEPYRVTTASRMERMGARLP